MTDLTIIPAVKEHCETVWIDNESLYHIVTDFGGSLDVDTCRKLLRVELEDAAYTLASHVVTKEDLKLDEPKEDGFTDRVGILAHQAWQQRETLFVGEWMANEYAGDDQKPISYFESQTGPDIEEGATVVDFLKGGFKLNPAHPLVQPIVGIEGLSDWVG